MSKAEQHKIPMVGHLKALQENPKVALQQSNKEHYNWRTDYDWTDLSDNPVKEQ